MADDSPSSRTDRDIVSDEVWYDRQPFWSRFTRASLLRVARVVLLIAALLFLAIFVVVVLWPYRPTPFIVVNTAPYAWPFPPQAWTAEDQALFTELDKDDKNINLLTGVSIGLAQGKPSLNGLNALTSDSLTTNKDQWALIIYISMHGVAVDGRPCLVPPGASPADSEHWIGVGDLLTEIDHQLKEIDDRENNGSPVLQNKPKLVVLDCSRVPVNWYLGWLNNDFAGALDDWWKNSQDQFPSFALMSSAARGERSWTSAELRRSVFAHYFRLGLAGEADTDDWWEQVSLGELTQYVERNVDQWVRTHRGDRQRPGLAGSLFDPRRPSNSDPSDPRMHWILSDAVDANQRQALAQFPGGTSTAPAAVDVRSRANLWERLDELRRRQLYRFQPFAWRQLEHQLLSLEQLAEAGSDYERAARRMHDSLRTTFDEIELRLKSLGNNPSIFAYTGLINGTPDPRPAEATLPSMSLAEYCDVLPDEAAAARAEMIDFQRAPTPQRLALARHQLERLRLNHLAEAQFLQMLDRYQFPQLWADAPLVKQLLARRSPLEDLGVPLFLDGFVGDERVHRLARPRVERADTLRRDAEDRLFIDGQPELAERLQQADEAANLARTAVVGLQQAMRVRDRAWAELAYFLQWRADPLRRDHAESAEREQLMKLAEQADTLDDLLAADAAPTQLEEIAATSQAVSDQLDKLTESLASECKLLVGEGTPVRLLALEAALANPLLPADLRKSAIEHGNVVAGNTTSDAVQPTAASVYSVIIGPASDHPILALLDPTVDTAAPGSPPADDGPTGRWWAAINSLHSRITTLSDTPSNSRSEWSDLDRQLRAVAPLCYVEASSLCDGAVARLRAIDLRSLVVWHAQRAVNDFWGPAGDAQPFFAQAANSCLQFADGLLPAAMRTTVDDGEPPSIPIAAQPNDLTDLAARVVHDTTAAKSWLDTQATSPVLVSAGEPVVTRINVTQHAGAPADVTGTAAVFLRGDGRRSVSAQFQPAASVPLPLPSSSTQLQATIPDAEPLTTARLDAMTMFRGHEFPSRFAIEPLQGVTVRVDPHPFKPGGVTLRSPARTLSVVLVLDGSQSMEQPLEAGQSRLAVAKEALAELLSRLGSVEQVRVGVRLFGHRVGWTTDRPVRPLASPTFAGEVPAGLTPDRDVERVLPLGPLDFAAAQQVFASLNAVEHGWGQSPLYFALSESLRDDFQNESAQADKHIIVITDGRNYQARPGPGDRTSASQVAQASRAGRVPVHILALAPEAPDEPAAASQAAQLATQTGGTYQVLSSASDLRQTLLELVQPASYQLENARGQVVDRAELGVRLTDTSQQSPADYTVHFEDSREDIRLDGGEAIDFYLQPGDPQLYAFPFDHEVAQRSQLATSSGLVDRFQRVHRPARRGRAAEFILSLQRNVSEPAGSLTLLWRWTPRPRAVWIEVTPRSSTGEPAGPSYLYYDANFEPDQPVPVLKLSAADWPPTAVQAGLAAWYRDDDVAPTVELPLRTLQHAAPGGGKLYVHGDFIPVGKRYRIRVVEQQPGPPDSRNWLLIAPPTADRLRPAHIERLFDQKHGVAVHTFDYVDLNERELRQLQSAHIAVATRDAMLAGAMSSEAVVVPVSDRGELLPVSTALGQPGGHTAVDAGAVSR